MIGRIVSKANDKFLFKYSLLNSQELSVLSVLPPDSTRVRFNKSVWTSKSSFTLTADLQSKLSDDFLSFTRYFLDIITDAGRELLEFQCFLHPAVALDSLIESDGVKHNKGDDLMGLQCLLLLKPFCNFHYQKKSLLKRYSFYFPNASCKQRGKEMQPTTAVSD